MPASRKHAPNDGAGHVAEPIPSYSVPLPEQKGFFKIPARFGHIPLAAEPLGYDKERRFEHHYPRIELPFQLVDVVKTGAERLGDVTELLPQGRNRLFFGDCLHVMRMLPSESIDLIYIDPPFFSGRNYNIIFGDRNEVRSFSDIWEGGMPGYVVWLNARLYEMKRLLKPSGSIYVHLDWHAAHYIKCELDKIFGYDCFQNEIIWFHPGGGASTLRFARKHDTILWYTKQERGYQFNLDDVRVAYRTENVRPQTYSFERNKKKRPIFKEGFTWTPNEKGKVTPDVWDDIKALYGPSGEIIGYPTQKPEALLERIIMAATSRGDVVADFFCGGGTTPAVAQKLGRRWVGADVSRVAVALTSDRIARILAPNIAERKRAAKRPGSRAARGLFEGMEQPGVEPEAMEATRKAVAASPLQATGYSVDHWGIYEINRLTRLAVDEFRAFVIACYGARKWTGSDVNIHGVKASELLWVAGPKEMDVVTATDVKAFAEAVIRTRRAEERQAAMIGWNIDPKAKAYAEQIMALGEQKPIQFIKLRLWPLAGDEFKAHVTRKHDKYRDFFAFILPPDIPRIGVTRVSAGKYRFDVSEARSMNTGGKIVNVQWDFDFRDGIFSATEGYQLCRIEKKGRGQSGFEGNLTVEYTFEDVRPGDEVSIACRVQDDLGGEGMKSMKLTIE